MQVCTSLKTRQHPTTQLFYRPTNSVKALKAGPEYAGPKNAGPKNEKS